MTGTFDLTIEAETKDDAESLLEMLEKRHYVTPSAGAAPKSAGGPGNRLTGAVGPPTAADGAAPPGEAKLPAVVLTDPGTGLLTLKAKLPEGAGQVSRAPDAALVLLLAYAQSGKDPTYGTSLMKSLRQTGYTMDRIDRPLQAYVDQGLVLVSGTKKSRAYHLSEAGKAKAE
ncbi:MAG TPA: hypothetical protein VLX59_00650, partial [Acidimicrobiales bacterium]|nr:hypothetical protein [Acidimicrobiales bacterium]